MNENKIKIEKVEKIFQPVIVSIQINTEGELQELFHRFNFCPDWNQLNGYHIHGYQWDGKRGLDSASIIDAIKAELRSQGLRP